ncbi:signal transduction histidine kinase [Rubrivivax gelatinosus]|uniref:sensor histidine kinase n=2 Tax=Rubrivivax gelatinosus TaxID=28068 RepID=UPI0018C94C81|nr:ATP-binding protein [Rubrivivax gelatinosus]MBG6078595.1 signal transduction histidine kinase [Rubrivivax gelatinosus]
MTERPAVPGDSSFANSALEPTLGADLPQHWTGWRRQFLVVLTVLGCLGLLALTRWLAASPALDVVLLGATGAPPTVLSTSVPALEPMVGRAPIALRNADGREVRVDALLNEHSPRWQVDDAVRERVVAQQEALAEVLEGREVFVEFRNGIELPVLARPRGFDGLGLLYWPLTALALAVYLVGAIVLLARPQGRNVVYLFVMLSQAATLLFIAVGSMRGLGLPAGFATVEPLARMVLDLAVGAAVLHAFTLHPRPLPHRQAIAAAGWLPVFVLPVLAHSGALSHVWWWTQGALLAQGAAALATISWSYRIEANPFAAVLRRLGVFTLAAFALVTLGMAAAAGTTGRPGTVAAAGSLVWTLFFTSLLLLVPFLSRSRMALRELAMLAGISTIAVSLDLLFVALFSLGPFTSLTLAVFLALGAYAGARQWILNQTIGSEVLTTERTFEQLYRVARELQKQPSRYSTLVAELLRELFEPLEVLRLERDSPRASVVGGGAALVVPVRSSRGGGRPLSLVLRFARRGQRLFSRDDARLAERVVDQLKRAVAYDQAVERGRNEERLRIAQDLHDDIGARLLTLMYQAQTPEMEDYIRHTLLDLKTLTRGLAAANHRLSHASAEWKADLTQRLTAAQVQLGWSVEFDRDVRLTVVQWSALTRVIRELVTNSLYHGHASRVDLQMALHGTRLTLAVSDDGDGRAPEGWAHGLGLGGVRKRVKLLGGEVRWRENGPRGIVCEVLVPDFQTPDEDG